MSETGGGTTARPISSTSEAAGVYTVTGDGQGGTLIDPPAIDPAVARFTQTVAAFAPSDAEGRRRLPARHPRPLASFKSVTEAPLPPGAPPAPLPPAPPVA
jgi:hypothetical protein